MPASLQTRAPFLALQIIALQKALPAVRMRCGNCDLLRTKKCDFVYLWQDCTRGPLPLRLTSLSEAGWFKKGRDSCMSKMVWRFVEHQTMSPQDAPPCLSQHPHRKREDQRV